MSPAYRRVLLKLSGEALMGEQQFGIDPAVTTQIAKDIYEIQQLGVQTGIVIGGGNLFRGLAASARGMDRATADYMGMLATVINALALQDALEHAGVTTRVATAIEMRAVAEPFIRRRAVRHMEKGRVVVFAAGTGNPYFTTDTAAALRAMEMKADVILKGTKVDGVYTADPMLDPHATKYSEISYLKVLEQGLKVMDATAISLCMDNKLPIVVFNLRTAGNLRRVIAGEPIGTTVTITGTNFDATATNNTVSLNGVLATVTSSTTTSITTIDAPPTNHTMALENGRVVYRWPPPPVEVITPRLPMSGLIDTA